MTERLGGSFALPFDIVAAKLRGCKLRGHAATRVSRPEKFAAKRPRGKPRSAAAIGEYSKRRDEAGFS